MLRKETPHSIDKMHAAMKLLNLTVQCTVISSTDIEGNKNAGGEIDGGYRPIGWDLGLAIKIIAKIFLGESWNFEVNVTKSAWLKILAVHV